MTVTFSTTNDTGTMVRAFQALADAKRLENVGLLSTGERCVCELTEVVGAKQPLLSFHLKTLREAGLVKARRRAKWMYYSLNYDALEALEAAMRSVVEGRSHADSCRCESLCCPPDNP